jgi:GH25 family lysozyme M1 (1,4-beta-N-acetylmuramidase)
MLWIAHWSAAPGETSYTFNGRTAIHQYSSMGRVPGINGNVDLDSTVGDWRLHHLLVDLR